jgi:hypothetical protein
VLFLRVMMFLLFSENVPLALDVFKQAYQMLFTDSRLALSVKKILNSNITQV